MPEKILIDWDKEIQPYSKQYAGAVYGGVQQRRGGQVINDEYKHLVVLGKANKAAYVNDYGDGFGDDGVLRALVWQPAPKGSGPTVAQVDIEPLVNRVNELLEPCYDVFKSMATETGQQLRHHIEAVRDFRHALTQMESTINDDHSLILQAREGSEEVKKQLTSFAGKTIGPLNDLKEAVKVSDEDQRSRYLRIDKKVSDMETVVTKMGQDNVNGWKLMRQVIDEVRALSAKVTAVHDDMQAVYLEVGKLVPPPVKVIPEVSQKRH